MSAPVPRHANKANDRLAEVAAKLAVAEGLKVSESETIHALLRRIAVKKGVKLPHHVRTETIVAELLAEYGGAQ